MASTQKKQEEARIRRKQDSIDNRFMPNTTNWVDPSYSERLARQFTEEVKNASTKIYLNAYKKSPYYIADEEIRNFTRVYCWDISRQVATDNWLMITSNLFKNNKFVKPENVLNIYVSPHALARMFLRLRTNSKADLLTFAKNLMKVGSPTMQQCLDKFEIDVKIPGGTAYMVADLVLISHDHILPPRWIMKTFIND